MTPNDLDRKAREQFNAWLLSRGVVITDLHRRLDMFDAWKAALRLAVPEWRPIETAPDEVPADDAVIVSITYDEPRFAGQRMVGEAYKVDGIWWWAGSGPNDYHTDPIEDMYGLGCVTHWQPLPAAPTLADEGEKPSQAPLPPFGQIGLP